MIEGFEIGTEVKWNENNTLTMGTVEVVYRESQAVEINDTLYEVEVSENSPTYLIRTADNELLLFYLMNP